MDEAFSIDDVDPQSLYLPDGSVDLDAAKDLLSRLKELHPLNSDKHPLGELTMQSAYVSVEMEADRATKENARVKQEDLREENPILYALIHAAIRDEMEIDASLGPMNGELYANPETELSLPSELKRYFSYHERKLPRAFGTFAEGRAMLGETTNDVNKLRAIIAIPVAGHQEYKNIYKTLDQLANQDLDPSEFEIILHINLPLEEMSSSNDEHGLASSLKMTLDEVHRFKLEHPNVNVRYFAHTYRGEAPAIGRIRSDLWSVIGYDMHIRDRQDDILVISADADAAHMNKGYVRAMVDTFVQSGADIVTANLKWQPAPGLPYDATVNRVMRYQTFLDILRDNHGRFLHTSDANTGISLATYFAAGGYDRTDKMAEMWDLVTRIRILRSRDHMIDKPVKTVAAKAKKAWLKSSSRRLIKVMALGHSPYNAWNQSLITFGANDSLRTEEAQVGRAEEMAQKHWKVWLKEMTPAYTAGIETKSKRRLLKTGRRILGFSDLYK